MLVCPTPALAAPPADRPRYRMEVRVAPDHRRVSGRLTVRFVAGRPTDRLVFRLWPDGPVQLEEGMRLDVGRVTSAGRRLPSQRVSETTLVVRTRLRRGQAIAVSLPWRLTVPAAVRDRIARIGGGVRLGSFFPILAWDGQGWATDPPSLIPGETATSPAADFDVTVRAPRHDVVLATGREVGPGHWRARAVRDFALASGPFRVATAVARAPRPVQVRVGVIGRTVSPQREARRAARALEALARRYGPYPYPAYTVSLTPDLFGGGIEYPTLTFQGPRLRGPVMAHETAHQWFYSLVGNNQARDPWLDETLASWGQNRLGFGFGPRGRLPFRPRHVGAAMSHWTSFPAYFADVYVGGVRALQSLGEPAKVDCALRLYAARNAYRVARPSDLLDALAFLFPDARRRLAAFGVHD